MSGGHGAGAPIDPAMVLESLLLVVDAPVSAATLAGVLEITEVAVTEELTALARTYDERGSGLDLRRTWFLNLETVGSPRLALLEGEGPVVMEDYPDGSFRDLVADRAETAAVPLLRGLRSRASTDSVVPARAGYPTATLTSINRYKALSNYHLMTDTPDRVDYTTVAGALSVTESVARALAVA